MEKNFGVTKQTTNRNKRSVAQQEADWYDDSQQGKTVGVQESEWYMEEMQKGNRYTMVLHNDASAADANEVLLNNMDFWFED